MCGIAVIAGTLAEDAEERMTRMVVSLGHRGPDAHACVHQPGCALGHTRLSIIDLESGAQPMADSMRRYWITFNGEIYNYRELREELLKNGVELRTRSDTEVVLAAYARWGAEALDRFRGMFAFAIWDSVARTLFAARDLFGEKPLYYSEPADGGFVAASELKALIASGMVSHRLNLKAVDAYLAFGYVPPRMCIYGAVRTLPPGHWLRWQNGRSVVERYWQPRLATRRIELDEAADTLRMLLQQAVDRQMVADVPVGAFLSGGLDSASIVALMKNRNARPVKTFSVGFREGINELSYAQAVAQRYRTEHHEIELDAPPVGDLLEELAAVYDEPFADTSSVPTYLISKFARQHVKVVLSGDGGDEIVGGYGWYQLLALSEHVAGSRAEWIVLRALSRAIGERARALYRRSVAVGLSARWRDMWLRAAMNQVSIPRSRRRVLWGTPVSSAVLFDVEDADVAGPSVHGLDRAFYFDLTTYLPGDILVKVDRAAMAHGLETRAPFLDRDLAEFALSLPASLKVDADRTKIVLRRACERDWPEAIRRRGKHGFGAPYVRWLQLPDVQARAARVFRTGGPLRSLLPGIPASVTSRTYENWTLLTLGLWLERQTTAS